MTIPPPLPADTPGGLTTWHCRSRCTCLSPINCESPESWPVAPSPIRGPSPTRHALCHGDMPGAPCGGLASHLVFISVHARARITASSPGRIPSRGWSEATRSEERQTLRPAVYGPHTVQILTTLCRYTTPQVPEISSGSLILMKILGVHDRGKKIGHPKSGSSH